MIAIRSIPQRYGKELLRGGSAQLLVSRSVMEQPKSDCDQGKPTDCDWRDTKGLSGGYCHDIEVKSVMDYLWNNHRQYFPLLKPCHRKVKRPDTYKPGNDPNSNHYL